MPTSGSRIPPPNVPLTMSDGTMSPDWYRFFASLTRTADKASAGEVLGGEGLSGGGAVSDGVTLGIEDGGVTDAKLREAFATSVIGRFQGRDGPVADIRAMADRRVLVRQGGMLVFAAHPEIESVEVDTLKLTGAPSASAATTTHKIAIQCDGATYYALLSNV